LAVVGGQCIDGIRQCGQGMFHGVSFGWLEVAR
jgi:hypothetical protein